MCWIPSCAGNIRITWVAPMLLEEKPRLTSIRLGEGDMGEIIKVMKDAYRWIGENR